MVFWNVFQNGNVRNGFESDIVLNSLRKLEIDSDDDHDIIGVQFRVVSDGLLSKRFCFWIVLRETSCLKSKKEYLVLEKQSCLKLPGRDYLN